mgnify:CR=1 FL=1
MEAFENILVAIDDFVWGVPLIVLILAAGIFLTCRVKLLQVFHLPNASRKNIYRYSSMPNLYHEQRRARGRLPQ